MWVNLKCAEGCQHITHTQLSLELPIVPWKLSLIKLHDKLQHPAECITGSMNGSLYHFICHHLCMDVVSPRQISIYVKLYYL